VANEIKLTLKVDDNGSLNIVGKEAEAAAGSVDKLDKSSKKLNQTRGRYNKLEKGVGQAGLSTGKAYSKMAGSISGGLVPAYAVLAANVFAVTAAFGALSRAAQAENLERGLVAGGVASGIAMKTLSQSLVEATGNALSLEEAMRSTALVISAGFDTSTVEELGKVAKMTSIALGRNLEDSLSRLTRGAVKLEPELLDELGIMVRLDEASENYAASIGKTASQLTNFEKRQGFMNAVLEEGERKFAAMAAVESSPYDRLAASFANLQKSVLGGLAGGLAPIVEFLSESMTGLVATMALFGTGVLKSMLPALGEMAERSFEAAKRTEQLSIEQVNQIKTIKSARKTILDYQQVLEKEGVTQEEISKARTAAINGTKLSISQLTTSIENQSKATDKNTVKINKSKVKLKESKRVLNALVFEQYAATDATNQNTKANVINEISHGSVLKGLKGAFALFKAQFVNMMANAKAAVGLGAANIFLSGTMGLLATTGSVLMVTFSVLMPIIAIATAAIGAIAYAYEKLKAMYTTEKEKAYESAIEDLTAVQEEQVKMTRELNLAFEGNSSMLPTLTSKYTSLNNILTDFGRNFSKAMDAADASNTKELAKSLDTQIKGNTVLSKKFKEVYGANTTLNQVLDKYENKLEGLKEVNKEVLLVEQNRARQIVVLSKAISEANKVATDFMNSIEQKTPYDEIVNSLEDISRATEGQQENLAQIFAENATSGMIKLLNVEEEVKNVRNLQKSFKNLNDALAQEELNLEKKKEKIREEFVGAERRRKIAAAERDSDLVVSSLKKSQQAVTNAIQSNNAPIEKQLELRKNQTKFIQRTLKVAKDEAATSKANLKTLQITGAITQQTAFKRNQLQKNEVDNQRKIIESDQYQLNIAKDALDKREATLRLRQEETKGTEAQEAISRELAGVIDEQKDLLIVQTRITADLNANTAERNALEDTGLYYAQEKVKSIQNQQKVQKAVLDLQKRSASVEERSLKASLEKERNLQRERNATDPTRLGAALTASDETKIKLDAEKRIIASIRAQGALKKTAVDLEFTLLKAQMKMLKEDAKLHNKKVKATFYYNPADLINLDDLDEQIAGLDTLRTRTKNVIDDEVDNQVTAATRGVNAATQAAQATIEAKERSMKRLDIEQNITDEVEKQSNELSNQAGIRLDIEKLENRTKGGAVKSQIRDLAIAIKRKNLEVVIAKQRLAALIASQAIEGEIAAAKLEVMRNQMIVDNDGKDLTQAQLNLIAAQERLINLQSQNYTEAQKTARLEIRAAEKRAGLEGGLASETAGASGSLAQTKAFESNVDKVTNAAIKRRGAKKIAENARIDDEISKLRVKSIEAGIDAEMSKSDTEKAAARARQSDAELEIANLETTRSETVKTAVAQATGFEVVRGVVQGLAQDLKALGPEGEVMAAVIIGVDQMAEGVLRFGDALKSGASNTDKVAAGLSMVSSMIGALAQMQNAQTAARVKMIDKEIAAERKRDGNSASSIAKITSMEKKKEATQRKNFDRQKKMQMAQIVLSTAAAAIMAGAAMAPLGPLAVAATVAAISALGLKMLAIAQSATFDGGGSGAAAPPSQISVGSRQNRVDLARNNAGGELSYMRGESGTGASASNFTPTPAFAGARYRAAGGATAGYVVGEQGPELFVPQTPGEIVPNDDLPAGAPINVNFNVQAIDATSFNDALVTQRGNIIGMIREAANNTGEMFLEGVDTTAMQMER